MNRWALLGALLGLGLLGSCGPTAEQQAAMDRQACAGYGFAPGTDAFANCLMTTTHQREAQQAADQRAAANRAAADKRASDADRAAKDAADRDAWDRTTNQGKYADTPSSATGSSASGIPDLSGMNCTSKTVTTGSPNDSSTTTSTSCHN